MYPYGLILFPPRRRRRGDGEISALVGGRVTVMFPGSDRACETERETPEMEGGHGAWFAKKKHFVPQILFYHLLCRSLRAAQGHIWCNTKTKLPNSSSIALLPVNVSLWFSLLLLYDTIDISLWRNTGRCLLRKNANLN